MDQLKQIHNGCRIVLKMSWTPSLHLIVHNICVLKETNVLPSALMIPIILLSPALNAS